MPPELPTVSVLPVLDLLSVLLLGCHCFIGFFLDQSSLLVLVSQGLAGLVTKHFGKTFLMSLGTSLGGTRLLTEGAHRPAAVFRLVAVQVLQNTQNS